MGLASGEGGIPVADIKVDERDVVRVVLVSCTRSSGHTGAKSKPGQASPPPLVVGVIFLC